MIGAGGERANPSSIPWRSDCYEQASGTRHVDDVEVYDLGEGEPLGPRAVFAPKVRKARRRAVPAVPPPSSLPAAAASLSLIAPGAGHLLVGEPTLAIFFSSAFAFVAALAWAVVTGIDRLVPTLDLLGVHPAAVTATLAGLLASACALHASGVLHAYRLTSESRRPSHAHPVLAGLASAAFPGWGQVVGGRRVRAGLFFVAVWLLAGAWLAVSPWAERVLVSIGTRLPAMLRDGPGPIALVTLTAVTWVVAVYDAVASAREPRRR